MDLDNKEYEINCNLLEPVLDKPPTKPPQIKLNPGNSFPPESAVEIPFIPKVRPSFLFDATKYSLVTEILQTGSKQLFIKSAARIATN